MVSRAAVACEDLAHAVGHHTAHLDPEEQIEVLQTLKRTIDGMIENIRADAKDDQNGSAVTSSATTTEK